jgi:hypothetical protein
MVFSPWRFLGFSIGLLVLASGMLYSSLMVLAPNDVALELDSGLLPKITSVPPEQNAMRALAKIAKTISLETTTGADPKSIPLSVDVLLRKGSTFDSPVARSIILRNPTAFKALERAVKLPQSVSVARDKNATSVDDFFLDFLLAQKPVYLMLLRSKLKAHDQDVTGAWTDALMALRITSRMQDASGTLTEALVAGGLQSRTLDLLQDLIPRLPKGKYRQELDVLEPSLESWRETWRSEYRFEAMSLKEAFEHPEEIPELTGFSDPNSSPADGSFRFQLLPQRWVYQPGRTLDQLSVGFHKLLDRAGQCPTVENQVFDVSNPQWYAPNVLGRTLLQTLVPASRESNTKFCDLVLNHAVTSTKLALRERQLRGQVLPDSLEDLSDLPVDPVTSKPLVWNAKTRTLIAADGSQYELGF